MALAAAGTDCDFRIEANPLAATGLSIPIVGIGASGGGLKLMQRLILDDIAPAAALVNRQFEILSTFGPVVRYLKLPAAGPSKDLLAMARPGLRTKIRSAVQKALSHGQAIVVCDARVKRDGLYHSCSITVNPFMNAKDPAALLLVIFQDCAGDAKTAPDPAAQQNSDEDDLPLIQQLEHELASAREDVQNTIQDFGRSTEELKESNEEVMSMNEELQSANEELQTSKEELQSLNEELITLNSQLQEKVDELDKSNNDILNLMTSSEVATLFLDQALRIKRFTPLMADMLNLLPGDCERRITDLALNFDATLLDDCQAVLSGSPKIEREVWLGIAEVGSRPLLPLHADATAPPLAPMASNDAFTGLDHRARCFLRRMVPYRTARNGTTGIVIAFIDITQRVAAEMRSRRLATVLWDSNDAIIVQAFDGRILAWNRSAERIYGYTEEEAVGLNIRDLIPERMDAEATAYLECIRRDERVSAQETQRLAKDGRLVDVELTANAYRDELGAPIGVTTTERDISERKQLLQRLQNLNESLETQVADRVHEVKLLAHAMSHLGEGVVITSDRLIWPGPPIVYVNDAFCNITGYSRNELLGNTSKVFLGERKKDVALRRIKKELSANRSCLIELISHRKDGTRYDAELFITPLFDTLGNRANFVAIYRDISGRKRAERALHDREVLARSILDSLTAHVAVLDQQGRIIRVNAAWSKFAGENGIADPSRIGVGSNLLEFCELAAAQGDEVAAGVARGLGDLLSGRSREFIMEYPYPINHTERWYHLSATPIRSSEGGAVISQVSITDRKLAEIELRGEHELSESIIETSQMIVLFLDPQGRIVRFNRYMEELTGWRLDEIRGHDWFETCLPEREWENSRRVFRLALRGESTRGEISPLLTKDGKEREIEWFDSPLTLGQVQPIGLLCTGNDVTEYRQFERRRDAQYQLTRIMAQAETSDAAMPEILRIISQSLDWQLGEIWIHDPQTDAYQCQCVWRSAAKELNAFETASRNHLAGDDPRLIGRIASGGEPVWLSDLQSEPEFPRAAAAKTAGLHTAFGFPILRRGDVVGIFTFFATERRSSDKKLQKQMEAFGKQIGDFIHRKANEKALRDREEQLRAVLETANDAIITIDQRGIVQSVNPATVRMFQYDTDELIGQNISLLMPQPYRREHDTYLRRYQETAEPSIIGAGRELTGLRKDGSVFPIDLAISEVDHMGLYTGIIRDISLRKDLQKQVLEICSEEQRRIGQELHDGTGQELTGLTLFARTLNVLLNEKPCRDGDGDWRLSEAEVQQLRQIASRLSSGLSQANQHVQQLSHGILPVQVEPAGLAAALEQLAIDTDAVPGVTCSCEIPDAIEVANNTTATHLYRIAQEAVNNALRHSQATDLQISLRQLAGEIVLEIDDNGVGFQPQLTSAPASTSCNRGCGLEIMNYRAGIIGGSLQIGPGETGGTSVRCIVHRGSEQHD